MKFGISKVTPDDEESRYFITIDTETLTGVTVEHFGFYCSKDDIQMIQRALLLEHLPHPQRPPEGCPAKGFKTCVECARRNIELLKKVQGS